MSDTSDDTLTITVDLVGTKVKLPVRRSDEQYFRETAVMMKETYNKYVGNFPPSGGTGRSIDFYLRLVAVDYGVKLKKLVAANEELKKKLSILDSELEKALEE